MSKFKVFCFGYGQVAERFLNKLIQENKDFDFNITSRQKTHQLLFENKLKINSYKFDDNNSLYDTVLVSANDELVSQFLNNNISYKDINVLINKILNIKEFRQLKRKIPQNINEIVNLNKYVRLKTLDLCIKDRK